MKIIKINWVDSCTDPGWKHLYNAKEEGCTSQCETVGYLIKSTRKEVTVCQNRSFTTESVGELMTIPKGCIIKITRLTDKED